MGHSRPPERTITMLTISNPEKLIKRSPFASFLDNLDIFSDLTWTKSEDGSVSMYIDLPGVREGDLAVEVVDYSISVKAERKDRGSAYSFVKSFTVPRIYDITTLMADLSDGVLSLSLQPAKKEVVQAKKITVNSKTK